MNEFRQLLDEYAARTPAPFSAASLQITHRGTTVVQEILGTTRNFRDDGSPLWTEESTPITTDTRFDVASLSKLVTAAALLEALIEHGITPDIAAADLLPEFVASPTVRLRHLLNHTAGLPAEWDGWRAPQHPSIEKFRETRPLRGPGEKHDYSCVGYIWSGLALEALTGETFEEATRRLVLDPLKMIHSRYRIAEDERASVVATEIQRRAGRGLVQGEVHDEAAWSLGGAVGNAGLFSTAQDLSLLAEALRLGGDNSTATGFSASTVRHMSEATLTPPPPEGFRQALGPRIGERDWMGTLAESGALGHTGFTGTSLLVDRSRDLSVVLLTNRVHPSRTLASITPLRYDIHTLAAQTWSAS